jgi:hypothetical protein
VEGFLPIFYLMVILKIPVALMLLLVWWAIRAEPETEEAPPSDDREPWPQHGRGRRPRGPRRGPHAPGARPVPDCPPGGRSRVLTAPAHIRAEAAHSRGAAEPAEF